MQPVLDVFKEFYEVHEVERMIRDEVIEIAPLVFMRGRTLKNAFIVADEMQNATPEQMKMFLTRIGEKSMMVITGDMEQHDRPDGQASGLTDFIQRFMPVMASSTPCRADDWQRRTRKATPRTITALLRIAAGSASSPSVSRTWFATR
jgi:phosphate starvation-inducible protein PhoH